MRRILFCVAILAPLCLPSRSLGRDLKSLPQEEPFHCEGLLKGVAALTDLDDETKVATAEDLKKRRAMEGLSESAQGLYTAFFERHPGHVIRVRGRRAGKAINHAGRAIPRLWAEQQKQEADEAETRNDGRAENRRALIGYGIPLLLMAITSTTSLVIQYFNPEATLTQQPRSGLLLAGASALAVMLMRIPYDLLRSTLKARRDLSKRKELSADRLTQSFNLPRITDQMIEDFISPDPFEKTVVSLYSGNTAGKDYLVTYGRNSNREPFIVIAFRDVPVPLTENNAPAVPSFVPPY